MSHRLAALLFCAWATGCQPGPTTLALDIDAAAGVTVQSLALHLSLGSDDAGVSESLPPTGAMPTLPGRVVVRLPDVAMDVGVALDGQDVDGAALHAETTVQTIAHEQVSATLTLGGPSGGDDLGGGDLAMPVDAGQPCPVDARCNYTYRRALTIHNGAASTLPAGYTVRVPLDPTLVPSTKTRADLNDVRVFVDPAGAELYREIDSAPPGQTRALWIALAKPIAAGASDTSYALYYGDANAGAPLNDASKVFALWDGFDGTAPSFLWTVNGAPTVGGGNLTLHMNGSDALMTTATTPAVTVVEWRSRVTDPASAGQVTPNGTFWWWVGFQDSFTPADPWIVWIQRSGGPVDVHGERKISSSSVCNNGCNGPSIAVDNAFHWYRIERDVNTTRWYYDGALSYSVDDPNNAAHPLMLRDWGVTSDLVVDWIRTRALITPEPTVTVGAEVVQ